MSLITDTIKNKLDLVELVREYVPEMKKAGTNWKARCPFHQEKSGSFMVSSEKQIWHCFGCGKGGDAFGFIKEIEGVEFGDALRLLAQRVGVPLEQHDQKADTERSRTIAILELSAAWFHKALLASKSGVIARDYLAQRRVSAQARDAWRFGFAPELWDELLKYLASRGYTPEQVAEAGMAIANNRGGYYDRFRNRLMFPITDVHGVVVGFTGRKLKEDEQGGKYVNTPETGVYHKSEILYGLSRAKDSIRKNDLAIVVEGNMDCVSSHQAGVQQVIAASGTALTPEQVRLIKRFTKNICLAFDPDNAGQVALLRGLEVAWKEEMVVRVAALPKGKDPDALIQESVDAWKALVNNAPPFMDWLFEKAKKDNDATTVLGKKAIAQLLLPWLSRIPDAIEQTHYIQQLSALIRVDERILRQKVAPTSTPARSAQSGTQARDPKQGTMLEQASLELAGRMIVSGNMQALLPQIDGAWLADDNMRALYKSLIFFYDSNALENFDQWFSAVSEENKGRARALVLLVEDIAAQRIPEPVLAQDITMLMDRLRNAHMEQHLHRLRAEIKHAEELGETENMEAKIKEWQEIHRLLTTSH